MVSKYEIDLIGYKCPIPILKIKKYSNDTIHEDLQLLANFSHAGHRSSGNKNYMLLAVNVYLYLMDNTIGFINIFT
jgi:hypothetical protein